MTVASSGGRFLRGQSWEKFSARDAQADFYVAADGDDSWSGALPAPASGGNDGPFATIGRAQEAVRQLKPQIFHEKKAPIDARFIGSPHRYGRGRDIVVLIRGGYYSLEKPLRFGPDDGGERVETDLPTGAFEFHKLKDHFVTYAAYPGETPTISGGRAITAWRQETGKWVTDVGDLDITKLLANGRTQTLARTPNEGYFTPADMPESTGKFTCREGDLQQWPGMESNRIVMLLRWHRGVNSIASVGEDNVVSLAQPQPGIVEVPPRYYVENVEALLDSPGEWFHDAVSGRLSYIPEEGLNDPNQATMVTPLLSQVLVVEGRPERPVRNLRFYGLAFEATKSADSAVSLVYATGCECVSAIMKGLGNKALQLGKGCYLNRILDNSIEGADEGGIHISGSPHPDWADLIHGNIISRNRLRDCGGTSIHVSNSRDTLISHNTITATRGRTPMQVGGWSNVETAIEGGYRVEYNHLHHVQEGADDSGAITTSGLTTDSIIRGNLIHDVQPGFFNDNVAVWFDNMSAGWTVVDNIYYNLKQAEMKLCACGLEDNVYEGNFGIEAPTCAPEDIIEGHPEFEASGIGIERAAGGELGGSVATGQFLMARATIRNNGATGIARVDLYVDGKVVESRKFAVIRHNSRDITFDLVFCQPGTHVVSIGTGSPQVVEVGGEVLRSLHRNLQLSASTVPLGDDVAVSAVVENVSDRDTAEEVELYVNGRIVERRCVSLPPGDSQRVHFRTAPDAGRHQLSIGTAAPACLTVYAHRPVDIAKAQLHTHVSGTAKPCEFTANQESNRYTIKASGTDLLHAEDSYGAIYLKGIITGNFVATVKVAGYQQNVNPWYRAGIFVRNDLARSYETEPGSLGSVLMYTTPKVAGIQWDAYGDGCMHKSGDGKVYGEEQPFPVWLKLVRHGDTFTGYTSRDGDRWTDPWSTAPIPGLADAMDIGMAAGTIDQIPALVLLENFALAVEEVS